MGQVRYNGDRLMFASAYLASPLAGGPRVGLGRSLAYVSHDSAICSYSK